MSKFNLIIVMVSIYVWYWYNYRLRDTIFKVAILHRVDLLKYTWFQTISYHWNRFGPILGIMF